MNMFDDSLKEILSNFNDWIKIGDDHSKWTIEDFHYKTGVDEKLTKPHCWKCVTVNQCIFKNEENKKPEEFDYSNYSFTEIPNSIRGLYHPNCHCKKKTIPTPKESEINFVIPYGKVDWMIKDKGHLLNQLGYKEFND